MSPQSEERYWIAINGASYAISSFPLRNPMVTPTPELLIGFPTLEEAQEALDVCLHSPIAQRDVFFLRRAPDVKAGRIRLIRPEHSQPSAPGDPTMWTDSADVHGVVQEAHIKHAAN
jgi:hypothetical protein